MTKHLKIAAVVTLALVGAAEIVDANPTAKPAPSAAATYKDIEKTLGFVPAYIRSLPAVLVPSWWDGIKALELSPTTALDGKTKELIGLAVAAATPCEYCITFHTEAAKLHGATEQELQEAIGMAAVTRSGSTLLNGLQVDKVQFRRDVERIVASTRKAAKK